MLFNNSLNCLPNYVEKIYINQNYIHEIKVLPTNLKLIKCSHSYQYIDKIKEKNIKVN